MDEKSRLKRRNARGTLMRVGESLSFLVKEKRPEEEVRGMLEKFEGAFKNLEQCHDDYMTSVEDDQFSREEEFLSEAQKYFLKMSVLANDFLKTGGVKTERSEAPCSSACAVSESGVSSMDVDTTHSEDSGIIRESRRRVEDRCPFDSDTSLMKCYHSEVKRRRTTECFLDTSAGSLDRGSPTTSMVIDEMEAAVATAADTKSSWTPSVIAGSISASHRGVGVNTGSIYNFYKGERAPSAEAKYCVPDLFHHFVPREEHETAITSWMLTAEAPALLRIRGQGSAGKTSLAISAATRSSTCRFQKALWIRADHVHMEEEELNRIRAEVMAETGRVLLVIDDVQSDKVIKKFQRVAFLMITTRHKVGKFSKFKMQDLPIEGLTPTESERLLKNVLSAEEDGKFEELVELQALPTVLRLCDQSKNYPLSVQLIGYRLEEDHCEWCGSRERVEAYLRRMTTNLERSKRKLEKKAEDEGLSAYTEYKFGNTHAAIFESIERLSAAEKDKYRYLTIYRMGEPVRPVTTSVIWEVDDEDAKEQLIKFSKRSLLTDVGCNYGLEQREFVMHDLVFDVIQVWRTDKLELTSDVIRRYAAVSTSGKIVDADETFYRRVVSWCLLSGQLDAGMKIVCDLRHLAKRVGLRFTSGMFQDLDKLSLQRPAVVPWRDMVGRCLRTSTGDTKTAMDFMIRIALLMPHDEPAYEAAVAALKGGEFPDRPFLTFHSSPCFKPGVLTLHPSRALTGLPESSDRPLVDINAFGEVAVSIGDETLFFDDTEDSIKSKFVLSEEFQSTTVRLLKWIDDSACLLVTGDVEKEEEMDKHGPVTAVILERLGGGWVLGGTEVVLVDFCGSVDMKFAAGSLWVVVDWVKLRCFQVTRTQISLVREDDIERVGLPRLTIDRSGNLCAVSGGNSFTSQVFAADGCAGAHRIETEDPGIVAAILPERKLLMACCEGVGRLRDEMIVSIYDMDRSTFVDRRLAMLECFSIFDTELQVIEDAVIIRHHLSTYDYLCLKSGVHEKLRLSFGKKRDSYLGDDVIVVWSDQCLTLYPTHQKVLKLRDVDPERAITSFYKIYEVVWWEKVNDFVAVYSQKQGEKYRITAQLLREKKDILSISTSDCHTCLSVVSGRLTVASKSHLTEFDLLSGQELWSLTVSDKVAVAYTGDGLGLWIAGNSGRYRVVDGRKSARFEIDDDFWGQLTVLNDDICIYVRGSYFDRTVTAWRGADRVLSREGCVKYCVNPGARLAVILTESRDVFLWRLDHKTEKLVWSVPDWIVGAMAWVLTKILISIDGQKFFLSIDEGEKQRWVVDLENACDAKMIDNDLVGGDVIAFSSSHLLVSTEFELRLVDHRHGTSLFLTPSLHADDFCISSNADLAVAWRNSVYHDKCSIHILDLVQSGRRILSDMFR